MLFNVEEIALTQAVLDSDDTPVTGVLGRALAAGIGEAAMRQLRVQVVDDYRQYAELVSRHAVEREPHVKPSLDRDDFAGFLVRDGERVIATSGYYVVELPGALSGFLADGLQRPEERRTAADGLEEIPLAARLITGRVAMSGAFWVDPAYRSYTSLFPVLRDCMMPVVLGTENPDYMVSFIREKDARRGRGLHSAYGLINFSQRLRWRDYGGSGEDLMVRLIWADRLTLINQTTRIAVSDY